MSFGVHLDSTLNVLQETRFKNKHLDKIKSLVKVVHFTPTEIESLFVIYYKFARNNPRTIMKGKQMKDLVHNGLDITDPSMSMLVTLQAMVYSDVPLKRFTKFLSIITRGTLEEKISHCYKVYDFRNEGKLTTATLLSHFESAIMTGDNAESDARDFIEIIVRKMDLDKDGKLTFEDYKNTILTDPLLMETFGQCLPSPNAVTTFFASFIPKARTSRSSKGGRKKLIGN